MAVARELAGFLWALLHEYQWRRGGDGSEAQGASVPKIGVSAFG